jgi:hypothetical protein
LLRKLFHFPVQISTENQATKTICQKKWLELKIPAVLRAIRKKKIAKRGQLILNVNGRILNILCLGDYCGN